MRRKNRKVSTTVEGRPKASRAGRWTSVGLALLVGVSAFPSTAVGQDRTIRDCRCLGPDGEEIENCRCLRAVESDELGNFFSYSLDAFGGARIGVMVETAADGQDEAGVRIEEVDEDGAAWDAGLREGDVVIRVGGRSVFEPLEDERAERRLDRDRSLAAQRFVRLVRELEVGEEAEIEYVRDGETRVATVTPEKGSGVLFGRLGDDPDFRMFFDHRDTVRWEEPNVRLRGFHFDDFFTRPEREHRVWSLGGDEDTGFRVLARGNDPCFRTPDRSGFRVLVGGEECVDGLELQELNPQLAEYFSVEDGVLVTEVREDATLGVKAGDVIVAIGGRAIEDGDDVRRILGSYEPEEPVRLTVVRKGERVELRGTRR